MKPGNAGGGKGLSWKQTREVTKTEGLAMSLATPERSEVTDSVARQSEEIA